jgi:hypothetical protein
MNPEIKQRIENLVGGSTFLPASSGATSGSKFDPMRVPSVDKDELLASINSMKGEGPGLQQPGGRLANSRCGSVSCGSAADDT